MLKYENGARLVDLPSALRELMKATARHNGRDEQLVVVCVGAALLVRVNGDVRLGLVGVGEELVCALAPFPAWVGRLGVAELGGLVKVGPRGFDFFKVWVWVAVDAV